MADNPTTAAANLVPSLIRTWVPVVVGGFISWVSTRNIQVSTQVQGALVTVLTSTVIALYYTVVRLLEQKWPAAGLLLGSATQPSYTADTPLGGTGSALPPQDPPSAP